MIFLLIVEIILLIFALLIISLYFIDRYDFLNFFKKVNIKMSLRELEDLDNNLKVKIIKVKNKIDSLSIESLKIEDENIKLVNLCKKQEFVRRKILRLVSNKEDLENSEIETKIKLHSFLLGFNDFKIDYLEEPILILIDNKLILKRRKNEK